LRHVVLNALFLDPAASGGPETYLRGLAPALAAAHPETRFTVVTTGSGARTLRNDGWQARFAIRALPCEDGQRVRRQVAEQLMLPALARGLRADVLHSLASVAPIRVPGVAHVITVHDVTFFRRRTFGAVTTWGMRQVVGRAAHHADALISATRVARDEVCDELGLDPAAFTIVHHGADHASGAAPAPEPEVRARYGLDGAWVVLCVATKRPHKNQEVLIRALPSLEPDVVLVLAGHPEPYDAQLRALADSLGVTARVRFADYVPAADLEALWNIAGCAAFPTLAEGFGIPVLEAMARGVGVAVSDIPVLREVGGDVPRFFDPHDPAAAARAIGATLADPQAGAGGPAHAAHFTWAVAAEGTWSAYERACASR
jgi:glycosyltransferase involved in cell wall biosynthesis